MSPVLVVYLVTFILVSFLRTEPWTSGSNIYFSIFFRTVSSILVFTWIGVLMKMRNSHALFNN